jgi:hypothetical protein
MAARELVLIRRYTTLAGGSTAGVDYFSDAVEVTPYGSLVVEFMVEGVMGSGAVVKMQLQEGSDLDNFIDTGTEETLVVGTPALQTYAHTARFVRLRVNLSTGSGKMAATLWSVGIAREA